MANNNNIISTGQIRIIGGRWRGRRLSTLNRHGLRPTTDRVRETLFNWLTPTIQGARCLDCYAGSGALGLEALSRGADSVTLLEQDRMASAQIFRNMQALQTQQAQIITTNSLRWLAQSGSVFNIVFIDPPFWQDMIDDTVAVLERHQRLVNNAWIYIETETESPAPDVPDHWQIYRKKVAGRVACRLYIRHAAPKKQFNAD